MSIQSDWASSDSIELLLFHALLLQLGVGEGQGFGVAGGQQGGQVDVGVLEGLVQDVGVLVGLKALAGQG